MSSLLLSTPAECVSPYRQALLALGEERPDVVVLGADLGNSTEIDGFRDRFPERCFNFGAAEQNMVGAAAGLAQEGLIPFVHSFGVFVTRRPYEQVAVQVAMERANVKLMGTLPGLSSRLGPTHQAIDDLALMRTLPGFTVIDPADATEIQQLLPAVAAHPGPVYVRMMRREVVRLFDPAVYRFRIGAAVVLAPPAALTFLVTGAMLRPTLAAAELLRAEGVAVGLLHLPTVKPLDEEAVLQAAASSQVLVSVENALTTGGLGSAVAELLAERRPTPLLRLGLRDRFACAGSPDFLFARYGLDPASLATAARLFLQRWSR
ncbi:MAG: transketolase C-terminal domain-containing protein [Myxococcota bacterium]|nr:transketolase C-terminal domain-containing protein [Myxococcota bacterium]